MLTDDDFELAAMILRVRTISPRRYGLAMRLLGEVLLLAELENDARLRAAIEIDPPTDPPKKS